MYKDIVRLEWFGGRGFVICVEYYYDFELIKIRLVVVLSMILIFDLLNKFFFVYKFWINLLFGVEFVGSIEVMINFIMFLLYFCI